MLLVINKTAFCFRAKGGFCAGKIPGIDDEWKTALFGTPKPVVDSVYLSIGAWGMGHDDAGPYSGRIGPSALFRSVV